MSKPVKTDVPEWYHRYIDAVPEDDLLPALSNSQRLLTTALQSIAADNWTYRYAPEKWSIKDMVQHIIDTERIFAYRSLCIARGEKASLPGFDENSYAAHSKADNRTKDDLLEELETVQKSIIQLFQSLDEDSLSLIGTANGRPFTPHTIAFITAGHSLHHLAVLKERYLPGLSA